MGFRQGLMKLCNSIRSGPSYLAILTVLILCAIIFKSFFAGVIITAPLIVANVLTFTFLAFSKPALALTTATLPVSAVGIGLGVDYGIYLVSRIIEEYEHSWQSGRGNKYSTWNYRKSHSLCGNNTRMRYCILVYLKNDVPGYDGSAPCNHSTA